MDFAAELERRLGRCSDEITVLRERIRALEQELEKKVDVYTHLRALLAEEGESPEEVGGPNRTPQALAGLTIPEAVHRVLTDEGRPMHASEIRAALEGRGVQLSAKDPLASVVTALVRGKKRGRLTRVAPNTYALEPTERISP